MPTWIEIEDYLVGQRFEASDLNTFKGNLNWLAQPPLAYYQHSTTGGDYSTSAVDNMVPIDPINMALQVVTTGGILMAVLNVSLYESVNNPFPAFGYDVDNLYIYKYGGNNPARMAGLNTAGAGAETTIAILMPIFGLAPGTHIVQPLWALDVAATSVIVDDFAPFFGVWEL